MILRGDCRASMAAMADASIDSVVTDPPYEIGFMGAAWDRSGIAFDVAMWREALRVLKPGGHLVAFSSPRTYHRMACAIEDADFEIRDQLMWLFGDRKPASGMDENGIGTCVKPAHEPIVLARKPLDGSARANILLHATGGLNLDACRVHAAEGVPVFGGKRLPAVNCYGDGAGGSFRTGEVTTGRWPANIMHDGSDAVVSIFPVTKVGRLPAGTKMVGRDGEGVYSAAKGTVALRDYGGETGSTARYFYCAKASRADREEGCENLPKVNGRANRHKTVKPTPVMQWLVRLVTPVGGLVLDPFAGSGSTGKAAMLEGRRFVGCELGDDHAAIAEARIAAAAARADRERLAA